MATIEVTARQYTSGSDLRASYAAARAAIRNPLLAKDDLGIDLKRPKPEWVRPPKRVPHVCMSDDQYAEWLASLFRYPAPLRQVNNFRMVVRVVARHFEISSDELLSPCRLPKFAWPRQVAIYISVRCLKLKLTRTGKLFGGRDHTTVLHSVRKVDGRMKNDQAVVNEVAGLMRTCGFL